MKNQFDSTSDTVHSDQEKKVLAEIGDRIAIWYEYDFLKGIDAVHFYLCDRHHWTPATVRSLKFHDLIFLVQEFESIYNREQLAIEKNDGQN